MLPLLPRPDPDPNSLQLSVFVIFASLSERYLSAHPLRHPRRGRRREKYRAYFIQSEVSK